jgi:hypothetical protein
MAQRRPGDAPAPSPPLLARAGAISASRDLIDMGLARPASNLRCVEPSEVGGAMLEPEAFIFP